MLMVLGVPMLPNSGSKSGSHECSLEKRSKLELALNQASDSYRESMAARRSLDTKIYGLVALSSALLALLITVKPWLSKGLLGVVFVLAAFVTYFAIIALGLIEYAPTKSSVSDPRAIVESMNQSYDDLLEWTTESLLDFADENYRISHGKAVTLRNMLIMFLGAVVLLVFGALLY